MKAPRGLVFSLPLLLLGARPAQACSICAIAAFDRHLPPVFLWCLAASSWFLIASFAARGANAPLGLPGPVAAAAILLFVWIAALGMIGPLAFIFPLAWLAVAGWRSMFAAEAGSPGIARFRKLMLGALAGGVALSAISLGIARRRDEAAFILKWSGTTSAAVLLDRLALEGPAGLEQLRQVAVRGSGPIVGRAAKLIARAGDPATDVPLLIDALQRSPPPAAGGYSGEIEEALRALSGLRLPEGSSAEEWRRAWSRKNPPSKSRAPDPAPRR